MKKEITKEYSLTQNEFLLIIKDVIRTEFEPLNKVYITKEEVEENYGIKESLQAKLRMDKKNGPPYARPLNAKVILYPVKEFNEWMRRWHVQTTV